MLHRQSICWTTSFIAVLGLASCKQLTEQPSPLVPLGAQPTTIIAASVGPGNCVLIMCPDGSQILNDCGSLNGRQDSAIKLMKDQIANTKTLHVVLSHADKDHISMVPEIADVNKVKTVYISGTESQYTQLADWFTKLKAKNVTPSNPPKMDKQGAPNQTLRCTDQTKSLDGIYVLSYNAGKTKNDSSLVLKHLQGKMSAIIMGDSEGTTEDAIIKSYKADFLQATMLVAAHHGSSNNANSAEWASATTPNSVIYSASNQRENYAHPRCSVLANYETKTKGHDNLSKAPGHEILCFEGQYDPTPKQNYQFGQYNTFDSGAIVYKTDGSAWEMYTCANNVLNNNTCKKTIP